ncbi:MAG TPA: 4-aminobutyrate--2-oxoglutarate transaminase [Actinomycetota bacterium]|nr:4-aminobutyrate--2-oxoglutarate transaminase [Actinomycetota bacterium]
MDIEQARRIVTEIPGPRSRELAARRAAAIPRAVFNVAPVFVERAQGAVVEDVDGNRLIDFAAGLAVLNAGQTHPAVVAAVREQAARYLHTCFHVAMNEPYLVLAERLNALTPGAFDKRTLLVNSGAEAVENAVKIARYATGRPGVVVFDHGFHGRTLLAMTMTAKVMPYKKGFGPFAPEVHRLPFAYPYRCPAGAAPEDCGEACAAYAIDEMTHHVGPDQIAAVVVEPVLGEGGFVVPGTGFLEAIRRFTADHGIVFVADEVQTGFGRTGRWFASEHFGIEPDLVAMAKALGGGLPLGAVTGRADLMEAPHVGGLGGTFGGNPLACAAALAVIDTLDGERLIERAARIGEVIAARFREFRDRFEGVGDVRGLGAMQAIEFVGDRTTKAPSKAVAARVLEEALREGLLLMKAGTYDNVIRLLPPLSIDDGLLDEGLSIIEKALSAAS